MFVAFIVQIVFRYLLNLPIGWTYELTRHHLALAGALGRRLRRHASTRRSASISSTARSAPRTRRVMAIVTAVALIVLYGISLPAVVDYVTFMKVQKTAYLKIRFDLLYLDLRPSSPSR